MPVNISIIRLNVPIQKVWDALTIPAFVKQWQFGSEVITDWMVGGAIRFRTEWQGVVFEQWGTVLGFQLNESLTYSLFAPRPGLEDKPENYFTMKCLLATEGDFTRLEIIQEDNRPGAVQEAPQGEENPILQSLKKMIESADS